MKYEHTIMFGKLLTAVLLSVLIPTACAGLGKKETPVEEKVRTEERTEIVFYMLVENPQDPASMIRFRPEAAAAYHLFHISGNAHPDGPAVRLIMFPHNQPGIYQFVYHIGHCRHLNPGMPGKIAHLDTPGLLRVHLIHISHNVKLGKRQVHDASLFEMVRHHGFVYLSHKFDALNNLCSVPVHLFLPLIIFKPNK